MMANELIKEIENMGLAEKLILVQDIWDSIARSNNELSMKEWQNAELDERYNAYKNGELKLHSWDVVHERLRNKYK